MFGKNLCSLLLIVLTLDLVSCLITCARSQMSLSGFLLTFSLKSYFARIHWKSLPVPKSFHIHSLTPLLFRPRIVWVLKKDLSKYTVRTDVLSKHSLKNRAIDFVDTNREIKVDAKKKQEEPTNFCENKWSADKMSRQEKSNVQGKHWRRLLKTHLFNIVLSSYVILKWKDIHWPSWLPNVTVFYSK